MTSLARAVAATAISVAIIALPLAAAAEEVSRRDQAADITAYLPPVDDVPWLAKQAKPRRLAPPVDAGSITALLWMPRAQPLWPPANLHAGLAGHAEM